MNNEPAVWIDPRRWIIGDEVLLDLARHSPKDSTQLNRIRGLQPGLLKRHGATLLTLIKTARQEPQENWPTPPAPRPHLSVPEDALVDAMMAVVRLRGAETAINPTSLANRKDLEKLLVGEDAPLRHGWRAAIVGDEVQALLNGKLKLEVRDGQLRTVPV